MGYSRIIDYIAERELTNKEIAIYLWIKKQLNDKIFIKDLVNKGDYHYNSKINYYFGKNTLLTVTYIDINEYHPIDCALSRLAFGINVNGTLLRLLCDHFDNDRMYNDRYRFFFPPSTIGYNINDKYFTIYHLKNNLGIYYFDEDFILFILKKNGNNFLPDYYNVSQVNINKRLVTKNMEPLLEFVSKNFNH